LVTRDQSPEGRVQWRSVSGRGFSARLRDGSADIGPLAPGEVVITAVAGRKPSQLAGTTTIEIVDAPQDHFVVNVFPGGRASGRLVDRYGRPLGVPAGKDWYVMPNAVRSVSSESHPEYLVDRDGSFVVTGPIGERCLVVLADDIHVIGVTQDGIDYTGRRCPFEARQEISGIPCAWHKAVRHTRR
jgi:hypothetical protein